MTKKWLRRGICLFSALLLFVVVLGIGLGIHYKVRFHPVRQLNAEEIDSIQVTYFGTTSKDIKQVTLTSKQEIAEFVEKYNGVKQSHLGIIPEFVTDPPTLSVGGKYEPSVHARIIPREGLDFELRPYLTMKWDKKGRFPNVLWVSNGGFFPMIETIARPRVSTRMFLCEETSLAEFHGYLVALACTAE